MNPKIVIADGLRTPVGSLCGSLSGLTAPELGAIAIGALYKNNHLNPEVIDQVVMGNALTTGTGPSPARHSALKAGLSSAVPASTLAMASLSGMKAVIHAIRLIRLGEADIVVAGGMESASNAPHYACLRKINPTGHLNLLDTILNDLSRDYYKKIPVGRLAEQQSRDQGITRREQDAYTELSVQRALNSWETGHFKQEVVPVKVRDETGKASVVRRDELLSQWQGSEIRKLDPLFDPDGSITSANSSACHDGASALILMTENRCRALDLKPLARIAGYSHVAADPKKFLGNGEPAILQACQQAQITPEMIGLHEIHENFASSVLVTMRNLKLDPQRVNPYGGSLSIGNPTGSSGARILVTLTHAMSSAGKQWACASIAGEDGQAAAIVLERYS